MKTWTATALVTVPPEAVLDALTHPEARVRWSPVPFEAEGEAGRLVAGTRTRVIGRLAGVRVGFDVDVHAADASGLGLTAEGPISLDVAYELIPTEHGCAIRATVGVRPRRGVLGVALADATAALLNTGALRAAVARIGVEATLAAR